MIFYFSATGNTKYTAQKIAEMVGDKTISISDCVKNQNFNFYIEDNEKVAFIFPTYFYDIPIIVRDFIEKLYLENYKSQHVYTIVTYGKERGIVFYKFERLLSKKGIKLNGVSDVIFPDNYILLLNLLPPKNEQENMFIDADKHINDIAKQILNRKLLHAKFNFIDYLKACFTHPIYKYGRKTKHFYTTDDCNGCKLCEKICPVNIIASHNGKPKWTADRCVQCLACLHRCPQKAIQHKKRTAKRERYINPNVKL
ncbi:EFR1 family ferrodoxin [Dysgonomonas sp. Marseille-P4677]|uniref:EFR1 family ferrodoxin n=1 Tax=Dysgonomonas sp. Marseille-P4677 TaxID=2364790 RepID=UPI0019134D50|nr:EFR1 family ferrodoxin [Dysgonomonas sp. Marseille-P4677]MBK5722298.1 EFR1 family ferrodoxin [Dysgonomonas sp. Marseille-P4677]